MNCITVSNIGKAYKQYPNKWARLAEWLNPFSTPKHQLKWILKDISFSVKAGESLGIIGVNGAGKSTLLKIITGTTQPTKGHVEKTGRIAALLELGLGFHPDFTGRQNAIMSSQLQGYSADEISVAMPEIERFADIGDYIDQPVRVYSSGMQVRLAFAVATAYRPEILIVDEALSVGDAAFQRKCFQRIEHYRALGTSLIFVSHDIETINRICTKALLLNQGEIATFGYAKEVTQAYEEMLYGTKTVELVNQISPPVFDHTLLNQSIERQYGNNKARIDNFKILNIHNQVTNTFFANQPIKVSYEVEFLEKVEDVRFGIMIKTVEEICIYGVSTEFLQPKQNFNVGDVARVSFELNNHLAPGTYYINCGCNSAVGEEREFLHRRVDISIFKVNANDSTNIIIGLVNMNAKTHIEHIGKAG